ncbi:MAG: glycine radical domain protein, partial [Romboutsia sp.]|nr:glycine radical domain protein [Romboutsia sp.]
PNCNNTDKDEMQVMRRTCGYIGSNMWGKGRTQEIGQRVLHL